MRKVCGAWAADKAGALLHWLVFKPNPVVQIIYLILAGGGFYVYVTTTYFVYCPAPYIPTWHRITGTIVMFTSYFTFYMASTRGPGIIKNQEDADRCVKMYEYDEVMYKSGTICKTCNIVKPPRSKHCIVCNMCVEKFDHHCIWLNNCIGRKNYKWFLGFLFAHIWICLYSVVMASIVWWNDWNKWVEHGIMFVSHITGEEYAPTKLMHFKYLFLIKHPMYFCVVCITFAVIFIIIFFIMWHLDMASKNETTNEQFKRKDTNRHIKQEREVLSGLVRECEAWQEKNEDGSDKDMVGITIDGNRVPSNKYERIKRLKEMLNEN